MSNAFGALLRGRWTEWRKASPISGILETVDPLTGKLLRPQVMQLAAAAAGLSNTRIIDAALALQLIHTASLLHDDVLDDATSRRGIKALSAKERLLVGDLLITCAYRFTAPLIDAGPKFAEAVYRMASGEAGQSAAGKQIGFEDYRRLITEKTGALFGWALSTPWLLSGQLDSAQTASGLGDWLGCIYQMLDDVLDWCPLTDTGKPALQDARQGKATLPVFEYRGQLEGSLTNQTLALYRSGAMARATALIEDECRQWTRAADAWLGAEADALNQLVLSFAATARHAYQLNEAHLLDPAKQYA